MRVKEVNERTQEGRHATTNRPYLGQCKFGSSCTHDHEPGRAVTAAVAVGRIAESRHQSYLRLSAS